MQGFKQKLQELQDAFDAASDRCVDLRTRAERAERERDEARVELATERNNLRAAARECRDHCVCAAAAEQDAARLADVLRHIEEDNWNCYAQDCTGEGGKHSAGCSLRAALAAHEERVKGGAP